MSFEVIIFMMIPTFGKRWPLVVLSTILVDFKVFGSALAFFTGRFHHWLSLAASSPPLIKIKDHQRFSPPVLLLLGQVLWMHNNLDLGVSQRGGIAIVTEKRRRTSNIMIARCYNLWRKINGIMCPIYVWRTDNSVLKNEFVVPFLCCKFAYSLSWFGLFSWQSVIVVKYHFILDQKVRGIQRPTT